MGRTSHLVPEQFAQQLRAFLWSKIEPLGSDASGRWLENATDGARSRDYWRKITSGIQAMTTNDIEILAAMLDLSPYEFVRQARPQVATRMSSVYSEPELPLSHGFPRIGKTARNILHDAGIYAADLDGVAPSLGMSASQLADLLALAPDLDNQDELDAQQQLIHAIMQLVNKRPHKDLHIETQKTRALAHKPEGA